jgi:hypothetical protein
VINDKNQVSRMATIDHLRCRFHPKRLEPTNQTCRHVLACYRCNSLRNRLTEMAQLTKDELRERAQNGHKNLVLGV